AAADRPTAGRGELGDVIDLMFISQHTDNFVAWRDHVRALAWDMLVERSGVSLATIRELAALYANSKNVIACWAMGLTQHKHAVATIQEIVNFMLLRGHV